MRSSAYVIGPFGPGTRDAPALPYGAQHLNALGYAVTYADPLASRPYRYRLTRRALRAAGRVLRGAALEPLLEPRRLRDADLVVCMLEDNLAALAPALRLLRRGHRRERSVLVVVWLAESVASLKPNQRRRWRRRLTAFGIVLVLSSNQVRLLSDALDLPEGLVRFVPFGVDPLVPTGTDHGDVVLSVGGDAGRDFQTVVAALRDATVHTTVLTTPAHRARLRDTGSVRVVGPVVRAEYLELLADAGIMVSATFPLAYPGGQTALLEAMQSGKACVVTRSEALDDYVTDGQDVLCVPARDPAAVRVAVERLCGDDVLRTSLGVAAARTASRFTEHAMWAAIADEVASR